MRVFVLTSGRTGSTTFAKACGHMSNYTADHESRAAMIGAARFDYPDNHIEADNRLSWFTGSLSERFPDAKYVHLTRDRDETATSYLSRWPGSSSIKDFLYHQRKFKHPGKSLVAVFGNGIVHRYDEWPHDRRQEVSEFLVDTVNANIREFLRDKDNMSFRLENATEDFSRFWDWIGADGDKGAALAEWSRRHNARKG